MSAEKRTICPFCSLHCADIYISLDRGHLASFAPDCAVGQAGYARSITGMYYEALPETPRIRNPATARAWLSNSRQPLVVVSGNTDCTAVSAAVHLAKRYSAILACDEPVSGPILSEPVRTTGLLSTTLGELHNLDLTVLCSVDMVKTHPRLIDFLSSDWQKNTLILNPADPLEMIRWLRLAGSGEVIDLPAEIEGVSQRIAVAQTGLVIFGPEWLRRGQSLAGELLRWLNDLNRIARWYTIYLAPEPNTIGVIETLLSETGYPGHFRFSPYGVDYYPQLWCAEELIESNMADLCLLIGNPDAFSTKTLARLAGMHTILISPQQPDWNPLLWLPCAQVGIDMSGVYLRVDGLPMQLQSIFLSQRPTISEILSSLAGGVL